MSRNNTQSETMKRFFDAMDVADYETAESLFSGDAVYVGPPFNPDQVGFATGMQRIEGLQAIKAGWAQRGNRKSSHTIDFEVSSGLEWFAEGVIGLEGSEPRVFMTHASFNEEGQILRFAAVR